VKIIKDLLYSKDNGALEIARLSSFLAVLTFLGATVMFVYKGGDLDFTEWGAGWAAMTAGSAAWIFARQRYEKGE